MNEQSLKQLRHLFCLPILLLAITVSAVFGGSLMEGTNAQESPDSTDPLSLLIYSRTAGFRHQSIEDGVKAIAKLAAKQGYMVSHTEDPGEFTDQKLAAYDVVIFLSTTGDVLDEEQQQAFKSYIQAGGGFVGVHSASDTEYGWPWYGKLVGAYFAGHPKIQQADIHITAPEHKCTHDLPNPWTRTDEWYNFKNVQPDLTVLAEVDETSYEGGTMGEHHPIVWCHEFDGGRSFYTALGHTTESYIEPEFIEHLHRGILWSAGR